MLELLFVREFGGLAGLAELRLVVPPESGETIVPDGPAVVPLCCTGAEAEAVPCSSPASKYEAVVEVLASGEPPAGLLGPPGRDPAACGCALWWLCGSWT